MNPARIASRLALAGGAMLAAGCATTIPIRSMQPGPVNVGGANHLVMVKGEGRRSARETMAQALEQQARSTGYFSVEDRTEDPIFVRVAGGKVDVEDESGVLAAAGRIGVRIDVLEWDAQRSTRQVTAKTKDGKTVERTVPVQEGSVLLAVTVFDGSGRAFLSEREYEGSAASEQLDANRDDLLQQAAAAAVARILGDITPRQVTTHVRMDDDDPAQETILATAKAGNVAQAAEDAQAYADGNPNNPAAAYNLAVLLDAMGRYETALQWYDRAIQSGGKDYYVTARAECARRLAGQEALTASPSR